MRNNYGCDCEFQNYNHNYYLYNQMVVTMVTQFSINDIDLVPRSRV